LKNGLPEEEEKKMRRNILEETALAYAQTGEQKRRNNKPTAQRSPNPSGSGSQLQHNNSLRNSTKPDLANNQYI
jgi:hypothetical protein